MSTSWMVILLAFGFFVLYISLNIKSIIAGIVFLPPMPAQYNAEHPFPVTWLTTKSNKRIPAYDMRTPNSDVYILFSHANAVDIGVMYPFYKLMRDRLSVNVLAYEYVGYGLAREEGRPSEEYCYESADAAYEYLVNVRHVSPSNIILFGSSVGTGPTVYLATKHADVQFRGIILETPFTSIASVVLPPSVIDNPVFQFLNIDPFQNLKRIQAAFSPSSLAKLSSTPKTKILIIHGNQDEIVPFQHGQQLYNAIPEQNRYQPVWVEGGHHNDLKVVLSLPVYMQYLRDFIDNCTTTTNN